MPAGGQANREGGDKMAGNDQGADPGIYFIGSGFGRGSFRTATRKILIDRVIGKLFFAVTKHYGILGRSVDRTRRVIRYPAELEQQKQGEE
jgi:hypothetical protein